MNRLLITNIQRFSLNDGPGIRTTVFCKGCSLRCPWCCNPENISCKIEPYLKDGILDTYGNWFEIDDLFQEIMKDRMYYESSIDFMEMRQDDGFNRGGVSFSGGECLLQSDGLSCLMKMLKREHIHIVVETALFVSKAALKKVIDYVDLFYVDMKIMDEKMCKRIIQGDINLYRENIKFLVENGIKFIIRIPMIEGSVMLSENIRAIIGQLEVIKENVIKVELLQEHSLGKEKYISLIDGGNNDLQIPKYHEFDANQCETILEQIKNIGLKAEIMYT